MQCFFKLYRFLQVLFYVYNYKYVDYIIKYINLYRFFLRKIISKYLLGYHFFINYEVNFRKYPPNDSNYV